MEQTYAIEIVQTSDVDNTPLTGSETVIELTDAGIIGLDALCRLCANRSDHLIPIYEGEGLKYQLEFKINTHLPFSVEKTESMPTHCCYQCASTLLTWHELVETSSEADRRLRALQQDAVVHLSQKISSYETIGVAEGDDANSHDPTSSGQDGRWDAVNFTSFHNAQRNSLMHVGRPFIRVDVKSERKFVEDDVGHGYQDSADGDDVDNVPLSERVEKFFKCGTCSEGFQSKTSLKSHLISTLHKPKRGRQPRAARFYCETCDYGFSRHFELVKHRLVHTGGEDQNHRRSLNDEPQDTLALATSIIKTNLDEYSKDENPNLECEVEPTDILETFDGEKEVINGPVVKVEDTESCDNCGALFSMKQDLKRHIRLRHPDTISSSEKVRRRKKCEITPRFFCDVCPRGFTRRYDMQKHRKKAHADVPEKENLRKTKTQLNAELLARCRIEYEGRPHYKCEHCSRVIHLSYNFLRHQTIHTGVRAFFCHLCGKSFRMSSGLNRHIKELHYGVKNYPCEMCGRCFASKNTRDDHMNIHTGARPFICDQCGKSFKQKASLHVHKIFHTNDKPFVCRTCGKRFRRATELKVHGWLHTGYKPHVCATCGSKFRLAQDLKRHQKTHSKDFQVSCEECGACFGQARYLKNHLKTHRKKDALVVGMQC